jgi:hypothetical protein
VGAAADAASEAAVPVLVPEDSDPEDQASVQKKELARKPRNPESNAVGEFKAE